VWSFVFVQGGWLLRIQTFILVGVKALRVYVVRVFIILSSFFIGILNSSVTSLQWAIVNYMVYDVECIIGCQSGLRSYHLLPFVGETDPLTLVRGTSVHYIVGLGVRGPAHRPSGWASGDLVPLVGSS
jgi:hypothetical protein